MDKFLVTGGAGFIGSNICRKLVLEGYFVRVVDNLITGKKSNLDDIIDKIEFVEADMGDPEVASSCVKDIDIILHQGALSSVPRSIDDPYSTHKHCVNATFELLMAAREANVKRFVYAASSSAYGENPKLPKIEDMFTAPMSPYAVAKLVGEYYCRVFTKIYGLETISLRYFNVFGPYQNPNSDYAAAIPAFINSIIEDRSPIIYGDGCQSRDFTYVDNIVNANLLAARADKTNGEVINIACGETISLNNIIKMINQITGKNIESIHADPRPGDPRHTEADISLAKAVIGFEPIVSFKDGLEKTIEWYINV